MTSSIAQEVWSAVSGSPRSSADSSAGQGNSVVTWSRRGGARGERRIISATDAATRIGSSGYAITASARDHVASHRSSCAADEHDHRRAVKDLVLELAADAHPAGWAGLAVEQDQVEPALVDTRDHSRFGGALHPRDAGYVGGGTAADGELDRGPGPRVVAVEEQRHRVVVLGMSGPQRAGSEETGAS